MKKAYYRLLQWTMLMGTAAVMSTACVVSSGDGDSPFDGGEGGTGGTRSAEAGEGGTSAGTRSGGSSAGGSASGGTSAGTSGGGSGGSGSSYVPGLCEGEQEPTMLPACAPSPNDENEPCTICIKAQCCDEWQTCYGDTPTSACGWGITEDEPGQFDCIQGCYIAGLANATDLDELQRDCAASCLNQCEDEPADMGFITTITDDLVSCANVNCLDECFPAE